MSNKMNNVGQILQGIGGIVSSLGGSNGEAPKEGEGNITLRYSSESVTIPATQEVLKQTVKALFDTHAENLGLPTSGDVAVRSGGALVDPVTTVESGRTYVASVARETKGN